MREKLLRISLALLACTLLVAAANADDEKVVLVETGFEMFVQLHEALLDSFVNPRQSLLCFLQAGFQFFDLLH